MKHIVFFSEKANDTLRMGKSSIFKDYKLISINSLKSLTNFLNTKSAELIIWGSSIECNSKIFRDNLKLKNLPWLSIISDKKLKTWQPVHHRHQYLPESYSQADFQDKIGFLLSLSREKKPDSSNIKRPLIPNIASLKSFILDQGEPVSWDKNKIIFRENRHSRYIYLISKGLLKTFRMDQLGKELITGIYRKYDLLGLYGFQGNPICPETASSLEASKAYRFPYKNFQELLQTNPGLSLDIAQHLTDMIIRLKSQLLDMAYASVLKKTSNTILQFEDDLKQPDFNGLQISRTDLASIAGISTESFIRSLSCLKKEGIIAIKGKNINILNSERLQDII